MQELEKIEKTPVRHFIALFRHGERGDEVRGMKFANKADPPLTPLGVQ